VDFVAVVDQVIALLRQRGRVTYRTLQLQFTLGLLLDSRVVHSPMAYTPFFVLLSWLCTKNRVIKITPSSMSPIRP
jgi:hypothetical protein